MFVFPMIGAVAYVHSSRLSIIVQIKMRAELTAAVYRKALALSSRSALDLCSCIHPQLGKRQIHWMKLCLYWMLQSPLLAASADANV